MNFAVSTGHKVTSQTAIQILEAGGNAIDAAVAAYFTACITEPAMASLAAGGFAMIYFNDKVHCLDFFCQTPRLKTESARLDLIPVDFGAAQEKYFSGIGSVAVPGATKGMFRLLEKFGTMPISEICSIAKQLCLEGVKLTAFQAYDLNLLSSVFGKERRGREIFFDDNELKKEGCTIKMEAMAGFLDALSHEGSDLMYLGETARAMDKLSRELGGHLRYDDLKNYDVQWLKAKRFNFGEATILTPPAPSMGHALLSLFLEGSNKDVREGKLSLLYKKAKRYKNLLSDQTELFRKAGLDSLQAKKWSGTSHFNIVDQKGNSVAMTFSIGEGSGIFLEGTDMHLNNMLGEPSLLPNGIGSWFPNTRLASMMTPTLIFENKNLRYLLGTGGAERIPSMLAQTIMRLYIDDMSLEQAVDAPRTYLSEANFEVEPGFDKLASQIDNLRIWKEKSLYFGGVHGIELSDNKSQMKAHGDSRREGHAYVK